MTFEILDAADNIQTKALALTGMKEAPNSPPSSMNQFPFTVTYAAGSEFIGQSGWLRDIGKVVTEIHLANINLKVDYRTAVPYGRLLAKSIWNDPTLGNTCDTVITCVGTFGYLSWGTAKDVHIGWRIETTFKQQVALS